MTGALRRVAEEACRRSDGAGHRRRVRSTGARRVARRGRAGVGGAARTSDVSRTDVAGERGRVEPRSLDRYAAKRVLVTRFWKR